MKKKPRRSFKRKMTVTLILSSTLPMLILGIFSLYFINKTTHASVEQRLQETLHSVDTLLESSFNDVMIELDDLGRNENILSIVQANELDVEGEKKLNNLFHNLMGSSSSVMNMYLVTEAGLVFGTYDLPESYTLPLYRGWGIYREANKAPKNSTLFYPNYTDAPSRFSTSVSMVRKINTPDNKVAYIILDVSTEYIQSLLSSVKGTSFGYIQFVITSSTNDIIYNDTGFKSPIRLLSNVFQYDRFSLEKADTLGKDLDNVMIESYSNSKYKLTYYGFIPNSMLVDQGKSLSIIVGAMIVMVALGTSVIGIFFSAQISDPIVNLAKRMKNYETDASSETDRKNYSNEVREIYYQFDNLMRRLDDYYQDDIEKEKLLRQSEIKSLMSQINPHFLHNTLDSIKWKAKLNETDDIATMVSELGFLLKGSMDTSTTFVSVFEELEFVESYIKIIQFRYGDQIQYVSHIDDTIGSYMIPKLLLQPLVENSIIHGIEPLEREGIIEIRAWRDAHHLYFSVGDNGVGSDKSFATILDESDDSIGIKNVSRRIKLYYGDAYDLTWDSKLGEGTIVLLKIPIQDRNDRNV